MSGEILCVLDGMTHEDFAIPPPLRAYHKGWLATTPQGHATESFPCLLRLLGVADDDIPHNARGFFEAVGSGIIVQTDDLVLRTTWVRTDASGTVVAYAVPRAVPTLEHFYSLGGYKGVLVYRHAAHRLRAVQTHPPYAMLGRPLADCLPRGLALSQPLAAQGIFLIPWGQARAAALPQLQNTAFVGGTALVRGMAQQMGMHLVCNAAFTGDTDTDIAAKYAAAVQQAALGRHVFLHLNGADEAAHRKDAREKAAFTQKMLAQCVLPLLQGPWPVLVTADHATSPVTGCHWDTPQPFFSNGTAPPNTSLICAAQALAREKGNEEWQKQL